MTCNSCGCAETCCCSSGLTPYYTNTCQSNQEHCDTPILCNYSPVVRVENEWAVPLANQLITLKIPALTDILIGATIWNPDYGTYLIVSYDEEGQAVKVMKTDFNKVAEGTVIPSCTKFIITIPFQDLASPQFAPFDANFVGIGSGTLTPVISVNEYAVLGEMVYISFANQVTIAGGGLNVIEFDLPVTPDSKLSLGQYNLIMLTKIGAAQDFPGTIRTVPGASKARITRQTAGVFADDDWNLNQNFFYKRGA